MGKFDPTSNRNLYQELAGVLTGEFATPAWFSNTVYFGASGDNIRAFPVVDARLSSAPSAITPNKFEYPGTTPVISANGPRNGILWAIENTDPVVLHAYDAMNIGAELYSSAGRNGLDCGGGVKWIPPTVADGKVFVPTRRGVCVFSLLTERLCSEINRLPCRNAWHRCDCVVGTSRKSPVP
jgi:hypothetical protein